MLITPGYYFLICTLGLIVAIVLCGPRRVFNLRHFAGMFLLIMYLTYVIRPVLAFTSGHGLTTLAYYLPGISSYIERDLHLMAFVFIAAIVSFALGYSLLQRPTFEDFKSTSEGSSLFRNRMKRLGLLFIFVGYGSFFLTQRGFIGIASDITQMQSTISGSVYTSTTGYIESGNYLIVSGVLLYYASTGQFWRSILLTLPWTINQIYFGWNRFMILTLYLGVAAVWMLINNREKPHFKVKSFGILVLPLVAILLIIIMRGNRTFWKEGDTFGEVVQATATMDVGEKLGDLAGMEGSWYMAATVGKRTPKYGSSIVYQYLIKPIPRLLWPGKPLPFEFTWEQILYNRMPPAYISPYAYDETIWWKGPVKGSIGYALEEWGWLGIPLNFGLTGLFLAWIERRTSKARGSATWVATYAATYSLISILGRVDIFLGGLNHVLLFYLPYLLAHKLFLRDVRVKKKPGPVLRRKPSSAL